MSTKEPKEEPTEIANPEQSNIYATGTHIFSIGPQKFTIKMISGYRYLKLYGSGNRQVNEIYKDLIAAAVIDPVMTEEQIMDLKYGVYVKLGKEIMSKQDEELKN